MDGRNLILDTNPILTVKMALSLCCYCLSVSNVILNILYQRLFDIPSLRKLNHNPRNVHVLISLHILIGSRNSLE